jgi:hypothetical protein
MRGRSNTMAIMRAAVEASWRKAKLTADAIGAFTTNAATASGQYLEIAGGEARRAKALLPADGRGPFWNRVRGILDDIEAEGVVEEEARALATKPKVLAVAVGADVLPFRRR